MEQSGRQGSARVWYTESRLMRRLRSQERGWFRLRSSRVSLLRSLFPARASRRNRLYVEGVPRTACRGTVPVNKINSCRIYMYICTACHEMSRKERVLPRYFALRCCHDRRRRWRQRRRPCVLTGWKTRCLSARISLSGIGFSCRRCRSAMLERNEDRKRELKAKRAFRGGAITVREKKRACGKFNFQIYENVFRESTNPLSKLSACLGYSTAFRLFRVRSALAPRQTRAAGIRLKAISWKYKCEVRSRYFWCFQRTRPWSFASPVSLDVYV